MAAWALALLFACSLFLVYYWKTRQPLPKRPLNVEENLPLPWLAQTSTVFSLTGLFGAYFGIAVTLGLPALLGLTTGTVVGLFVVNSWLEKTLAKIKRGEKTFEAFLSNTLEGKNQLHATAYALVISGVQCMFATSELLILREVGKVALGLKSEQATLLAVGVAILGYFYLLLGGYVALFRTDRIQLVLVCLMALAASAYLVIRHSQGGWMTAKLWPRPGFWEIPFLGPSRWLYLYHFIVAAVMALGLFLASPDTWKRIFQVNKDQSNKTKRILTFLAVGVLPYLVLLPFAIAVGTKSDAVTMGIKTGPPTKAGFTLPVALYNNWIFLVVALGLVASFLSSFNGAFLASVHIVLIWTRKFTTPKSQPEEARFYYAMMGVLIAIYFVFFASVLLLCSPGRNGFNNPWLLGNLLMGGYALIGGVQLGSGGDVARLPKYCLEGIFAFGLVFWVRYFASSPGYSLTPTILSVNTVPVGVILCLVIAVISRLIILIFGGQNARQHRRRTHGKNRSSNK